MPVTVEVSLKPSRWRWLLPALINLCFVILFNYYALPLPLWITLLVIPWLFHTVWRTELSGESMRLDGDSLTLRSGLCVDRYDWGGMGQRSFAFVRFYLEADDGKTELLIWRDSVSEPSWRALNMAFRVNAADLTAQRNASS